MIPPSKFPAVLVALLAAAMTPAYAERDAELPDLWRSLIGEQ